MLRPPMKRVAAILDAAAGLMPLLGDRKRGRDEAAGVVPRAPMAIPLEHEAQFDYERVPTEELRLVRLLPLLPPPHTCRMLARSKLLPLT